MKDDEQSSYRLNIWQVLKIFNYREKKIYEGATTNV
jgi:hypothetical protein